MKKRMRIARATVEQRKLGRGVVQTITKRYEPKRITLSERHESHRERHPNDTGEKKIIRIKKPTLKEKARDLRLEIFYAKHEYVGTWPNAKWVEINGDEEE
tara:strand:+ start:90 stop:392 length:303 start_codon:yes stop_codon:yes gene_type:complete